ncbi:MAG: hypothetical protein QXO51_04995 [Halobacteria archaeon]
MAVDPLTLRSLAVLLLFGALVVGTLHLLRKRLPLAPALAVSLAAAPATILLTLFRGDPAAWAGEGSAMASLLLAEASAGVGISAGLLAGGLSIAYLLSTRLAGPTYRSLMHMTAGTLLLFILLLGANLFLFAVGVAIVLFCLSEYLRRSDDPGPIPRFLRRILNPALRAGETQGYVASLFFLVSSLLVALFLPLLPAAASIAVLTFADPAAGFVGRKIGKRHWSHNPQKTKEGSIAFVLVAFYALLLLGLLFPPEQRIHPLLALLVAMSAALFESLPLRIGDNLVLPAIAGMVLVSGAEATLLSPSPHFWLVVFPLLLGVGGAAYLTRLLDGLGAGAAIFFGAIVYQASGSPFFFALLLLFGFAVALRGPSVKRSAASIVANGAIPAFAAVLYPTAPALAMLLFAGSIGAAAADTAASRVSGPRRQWVAAPAGAGLMGLLLYGVLGSAGPGSLLLVATLGGGFGGWVVVRVTSRLPFISKEESNLFGTLAGAAAAAAL